MLFLCCVVDNEINAQRRNGLISRKSESAGSLVISGGPNYCFGDTKVSLFDQNLFKTKSNWDVSIGFRNRYLGRLGYKVALEYGNYQGTDENSDLEYRAYSYTSKVLSMSVQGEYTISFGGEYQLRQPHSVYGFAGIGLMGSTVDITGLKMGGIYYSPQDVAFAIPFGIGYDYEISNYFRLGYEISWHYSLSDYVDGIHPPLYSKYNDILGGFKITLAYLIN